MKRQNEWQEKLLRAEADLKNKVAVSEQFGKRIAEVRGEIDDMERCMRDKREGTTTSSPPSPLTQGGEGWEDTGAQVLNFTRKLKYKVLNMIVYHIFPGCTNTYHLLQLSMLCLCSPSSIIRACKQLATSKRISMWRSHSLWYSFAAISESGLGLQCRTQKYSKAVSDQVEADVTEMKTGVHLPELQVTIV